MSGHRGIGLRSRFLYVYVVYVYVLWTRCKATCCTQQIHNKSNSWSLSNSAHLPLLAALAMRSKTPTLYTCAVDGQDGVDDERHVGRLRQVRERDAEALRDVAQRPRRRVGVEHADVVDDGHLQRGADVAEAIHRQYERIDKHAVDARGESDRPPAAAAANKRMHALYRLQQETMPAAVVSRTYTVLQEWWNVFKTGEARCVDVRGAKDGLKVGAGGGHRLPPNGGPGQYPRNFF